MRLTRIVAIALMSIVFLSAVSCATPTYHLSTAVNGQGSIMPSGGDFMEGRTITVLANPTLGWQFDHWEGALSGNGSLASLTMNSDKNVTAYFVVSNGTSTQTQALEFITYRDEEMGFSMSIPASWEAIAPGGNSVGFGSSSTCSGGYPAAAVMKTDASVLSLQSLYDVAKSTAEASEGYTALSEDEITIDGTSAKTLVYTVSSTFTEGAFIQEAMFVLIERQTCWTLYVSCRPACWNTYESTFNTMVNSFHMLK